MQRRRAPKLREADAVLDPTSDRVEVLADLVFNVSRKLETHTGAQLGAATLTHLETHLVRQVARRPGTTPSMPSRHLGLRSSNTSAVLRALEGRGLTARKADDTDRRTVNIVLTPSADRLVGDVSRYWRELLEPPVPPAADLHAALYLLRTLDAAGRLVRGANGPFKD